MVSKLILEILEARPAQTAPPSWQRFITAPKWRPPGKGMGEFYALRFCWMAQNFRNAEGQNFRNFHWVQNFRSTGMQTFADQQKQFAQRTAAKSFDLIIIKVVHLVTQLQALKAKKRKRLEDWHCQAKSYPSYLRFRPATVLRSLGRSRRRIMLFALCMALPTATLASPVSYRTGGFLTGHWMFFGSAIDVSVVGTDNTIHLDTAHTRVGNPTCNPVLTCYNFSSGTVTVRNPEGGTIFADSLRDGVILTTAGSRNVLIHAMLVSNDRVERGSITGSFTWDGADDHQIEFGQLSLIINPVAEPSTLGMPGTGLIGLARLARRKLKLWMLAHQKTRFS